MSIKIKKHTLITSLVVVNNSYTMEDKSSNFIGNDEFFNFFGNIVNNIDYEGLMQLTNAHGINNNNLINQGGNILTSLFKTENIVNGELFRNVTDKNFIFDPQLEEVNEEELKREVKEGEKEEEKDTIFLDGDSLEINDDDYIVKSINPVKKTLKQVKNDTLVIYIPGKDQLINDCDFIKNLIRKEYNKNSDILLLNYNKSKENKDYKPNIFKIEDFFEIFDNWLDKNSEIKDIIKNKKEIIIIGYSLGALYANKLVDHLRNGIFKDNTDILIPLILLKPFVNLNECINKLVSENFIKNFNIDLFNSNSIKNTSNVEIIKKRMENGYYNNKNVDLIYKIQNEGTHDLNDNDITSCICQYIVFKSYFDEEIPYLNDSKIKYSPIIILTSENDNIVGNGINDQITNINNSNVYNSNIKKNNIILNSNLKKNNQITNDKSILNKNILKTREMINDAIINEQLARIFSKKVEKNFVFKPLLIKEKKSNTIDDMGITNENLIIHTTEGKSDTLVIFIPEENLTYENKDIEDLIINRNGIKSDILFLDYNKSKENKDYSPDIFNIEDFFKMFDNWLDKNQKIKDNIKNKKEIIIIGHSLGALYANKLVDHLRNGILKDNKNVLIHLILIKPFSDINSCVNTLLKEVTRGINCKGINDELNKKTSNVEIIKERLESKNSKYSINVLGIDHDFHDQVIFFSIEEYINLKKSELKNNSKCCPNIILITSDDKDNVVGNEIIDKITNINDNIVYSNNSKNQIINSNLKKNNIIINNISTNNIIDTVKKNNNNINNKEIHDYSQITQNENSDLQKVNINKNAVDQIQQENNNIKEEEEEKKKEDYDEYEEFEFIDE